MSSNVLRDHCKSSPPYCASQVCRLQSRSCLSASRRGSPPSYWLSPRPAGGTRKCARSCSNCPGCRNQSQNQMFWDVDLEKSVARSSWTWWRASLRLWTLQWRQPLEVSETKIEIRIIRILIRNNEIILYYKWLCQSISKKVTSLQSNIFHGMLMRWIEKKSGC